MQGRVGNCGMIASMATLAFNKNLYDKVVPAGQNFKKGRLSNVVFNLYKLGKLHEVEVDKNLATDENGLMYGRSSNENLVGPLLEKALVQLHFDGNYESAKSVPVHLVASSLSNNFFEQFPARSKNINSVIEHGLKTGSQMVATMESKNETGFHAYAVIDDVGKKQVKLYDPHGEVLSIEKSAFLENLSAFDICYCDNKIFGMAETKTSVEITDSLPAFKSHEKVSFVDYDLVVEEDDTEILVNVIAKPSRKVPNQIFIVAAGDEMGVVSSSLVVKKAARRRNETLRENLTSGRYKVVVAVGSWLRLATREDCREYLDAGGNELLFRLAASKKCLVEKSTGEGKEKVKGALDAWHWDTLLNALFSKESLLKIHENMIKSDFMWWL